MKGQASLPTWYGVCGYGTTQVLFMPGANAIPLFIYLRWICLSHRAHSDKSWVCVPVGERGAFILSSLYFSKWSQIWLLCQSCLLFSFARREIFPGKACLKTIQKCVGCWPFVWFSDGLKIPKRITQCRDLYNMFLKKKRRWNAKARLLSFLLSIWVLFKSHCYHDMFSKFSI